MTHRDISPGMAAEAHLTETLERNPVTPIASIPHRRAYKALTEKEDELRILQSDLVKLQEPRAVESVELALTEIRNAREFVAVSGGKA